MYAVLVLHKTVDIEYNGKRESKPLSYADGMIGAIPVFEEKEKAELFAGDTFQVVQISVIEE